jgi:hypothetical protein
VLRLGDLYPDIQQLAAQQLALQADRARRRAHTVARFEEYAQQAEGWAQRTRQADTKLQLCELASDPARTHVAEPAPDSYTLAATDGSQIYPDRHGAAVWFVLNMGLVTLHYGTESHARLASEPRLFADEREVFRGVLGQRQTVTAEEVGVVRTVEELRALLALVYETPRRPLLALLDGRLLPWSWVGDGFKESRLTEYAALLAEFERLGVPLASYVSRSGANEVVNLVRLGDCDQPRVVCRACPHLRAVEAATGSETFTVAEAQALPCGTPAGLVDADILGTLLVPGERSALFAEVNSAAARVGQRAAFFYLAVDGEEIARVEMPLWVGRDEAMVSFVHAVLVDQLRKGQGYPVALREAHEQAVVRGPDRAAFIALLERALARQQVPVRHSRKSRSKQVPGV